LWHLVRGNVTCRVASSLAHRATMANTTAAANPDNAHVV
jgi:hypothetical protein